MREGNEEGGKGGGEGGGEEEGKRHEAVRMVGGKEVRRGGGG